MKNKKRLFENIIHGIFLVLGLITVGCVLLITVYLIISGIPAITKIGLWDFLFGTEWASTAKEPKFGILPFILTSVYGTAGAILLGVPIGFLTAVFLAKVAPPKMKTLVESAVSLLASIPSVVYGLVGMIVLVPAIRKIFNVPDGASLLAAIIVLAIMILPSIIKVSLNALEAVPKEYEDASLALGATPTETYFRSRGKKRYRGSGRTRRWQSDRRSDGGHDGCGQRCEYAAPYGQRPFSDNGGRKRNVLFFGTSKTGSFLDSACAVPLHHAYKRRAELLLERT